MAARLGPGVAVLVIGPTITGSTAAAGHRGTVVGWLTAGAPLEKAGWWSVGDGWRVRLDRAPNWLDNGRSTRTLATFPASSLMPLDGQAATDACTTAEPVAVGA